MPGSIAPSVVGMSPRPTASYKSLISCTLLILTPSAAPVERSRFTDPGIPGQANYGNHPPGTTARRRRPACHPLVTHSPSDPPAPEHVPICYGEVRGRPHLPL